MEKIKSSVKNGLFISLAITACLNSAYAVDSDSLATGNNSDATKNSVTVGNNSTSDDNSVTTGNNATSSADSVSTGNDSNSSNGSVSTGNGAQSSDNSVAQGNNSNASQTSVAVGNSATASGQSVSVGNNSTSATNSVTVGNNSSSDTDSIALGNQSTASMRSFAAGGNATATDNSFAFGYQATGTRGSVAFGNYSTSNDVSISMGYKSSSNYSSMAFGYQGYAYYQSFSFGNNSTASYSSVAFGFKSSAYDNSLSLGNNTKSSYSSLAIGNNASATPSNSFALGMNAVASAKYGMALGYGATSNKENSIALGYNSITTIGAESDYSAYGLSTKQSSNGEFSVGSSTVKRKITNIAAGSEDSDAVNVAQLKSINNNLTTNINTLSSQAVQYDVNSNGIDKTRITLNKGGTATTIGNVAAAKNDDEAVNFKQLNDVNNTLTADLNNTNNNLSSLSNQAIQYEMTDGGVDKTRVTLNAGGSATTISNLADALNADEAVNLKQLNEVKTNIVDATKKSVEYDSIDGSEAKTKITFNKNGKSTTLSNVADAENDDEAVNLKQLNNVDTTLSSKISMISDQAVQYAMSGGVIDKTKVILNAGGNAVTISNVADAQNNDEAVNLKQLSNVNDTLNASISTTNNNLLLLNNQAVQYDTENGITNKNKVIFNKGGSASTLSNVADAQNNDEAVNLKQLNTVNDNLNTSIATLSDQAVQYAMSGGIVDKSRIILNNGGSAVTISNVADAQNDNEAVNLKQLKNVSSNVSKVNDQAVQYDTSNGTINKNKITLNAGGSATTIANVADAKNDDEAVNLKQLNNVNDTLSDSITALSSTTIQYDTDENGIVNKNKITFNKNGSSTRLSNISNGLDDNDAVNLSQLNTINDTLTDKITTLSTTTIQYDTDNNGAINKNLITFNKGGTPTRLSNIANGINDNDAVNLSQLNNVEESLTTQITTLSTTTIQYDTNSDGTVNKNVITFNKNGSPTRLSNIANAVNDDDAVNLRQLKQYGLVDSSGNSTSAVTYNTDYTSINLDKGNGSIVLSGVAAGKIAANSTDAVNGSQFYSLAQALADTNKQVSNNNAQITTLSDQLANISTNTGGNNNNTGNNTGGNTTPVVSNENAVEYTSTNKNKITLKGENGTVVSNVADGIDDGDAVNVKQLKNTNNKIADIENGKSGMVQVNNTSNAAAAKATGKNSVAVGHGAVSSGENSVSIGANSNDNGVANTVSVGSIGSERTISNVAAGVNTNDAVNVGQLNTAINQNLLDSQAYTDAMGSRLSREIKEVDRDSKAGIAAAMAMATMPQSNVPGRGMVSVGLGSYESQSALSVGASVVSPKGKWVYKVNGSVDSRNHFGAAVGAGYQW